MESTGQQNVFSSGLEQELEELEQNRLHIWILCEKIH
jgi:hypothetical protein